MRRIIDSHAHLVQYIAGTGAGGELRSIGNGMAIYANGQIVRMIPEQFHGDSVSPEQILEVMDQNGVEKAVLLQGNFYGFQNYYTAEAVKKYPDRFVGAGSYDPFSRDRDGIRKYLFEELGFQIEKFEVSTGSGLMAVHPDLKMNGEVMEEACDYAQEHGCEFPYKSRVMGTSEPLKPLKAPYMARNPVKWVFFRLKGQEIPLKI